MHNRSAAEICEEFLYFGYVPRSMPKQEVIERVLNRLQPLQPRAGADLISEAANRIDAIMKDIAEELQDREVVVPISGGLDSRCILAALLKHRTPDRIKTVTMGMPGTLDFELGNRVARWAGTPHTPIDLRAVPFSADVLLSLASRSRFPVRTMEMRLFYTAFEVFPDDHVFITGFMGDPLAGSRLPFYESHEPEFFLKRNSYWKSEAQDRFFSSKFVGDKNYESLCLTRHDQLDFFIRQRSFIYPLFDMTQRICAHPFCDPRWLSLWQAVPIKDRIGKKFYKRCLLDIFPDAFQIPTKEERGGSLADAHIQRVARRAFWRASAVFKLNRACRRQMFNYIDFAEAFINREDVISTAMQLLPELDLHCVDIGKTPVEFLNSHRSGEKDQSKILQSLVDLAAFQVSRR